MKLDGLVDLYEDMKKQGLTRYRFDFTFNKVTFDVFFFIDEKPFKLMFGAKMKNFYFELVVNPGFKINTFLNEKYNELCKVLGLKYDEDNPFQSSYFFAEFNKKIPTKINVNNQLQPHEVAQYRKDVEEFEKIYFWGWLTHANTDRNVTPENLKKTKRWLGIDAYKTCQKNNISSRWTDDRSKVVAYTDPQ
ncbi:DUF6037 family protein [Bacillus cereus]|uniref:DUF6037 family protein n=1 Tax=Bacillus thuringiensis TaxID=1428 RepID=UPI00080F70AF|nr:DUF6037 family protein [Bacillus thuringiensis]ANV74353.1 hypothetical protein BCM43_28285 [Bacillus thuringiensis]MDA2627026.1 DUF6037 family protein [Bacillus cereus]PFN46587.1 hypothetical protein COJ75_30810 [Bacillus thuringiensis]PFV34837.1 hypothetical protein COL01_10865 [Bacillus thuringiensis]